MATLDELQAQLAALTQRVNEITAPPDDYYTHRFSGEEIDNAVGRVAATAGSGAITAGDVGAAPSGFGLGTAVANAPTVNDFDSILKTGWYIGVPVIPGFLFGNTTLMHVAASNAYATQLAFVYLMASGYPTNTMLIRSKEAGVWKPWEWINPPMKLGVEYRTTERHNGKPVYTKLVDCGAMPNNTEKDVEYSVDTNCQPISVNGTWSNGKITMPGENGSYAFPGELQSISASNNVIILVTHSDRSNYTANATVKYWKTTD